MKSKNPFQKHALIMLSILILYEIGGLVTDIVYKLATLPSGADSRIRKVEATCLQY